jgi:hypothetical protein
VFSEMGNFPENVEKDANPYNKGIYSQKGFPQHGTLSILK